MAVATGDKNREVTIYEAAKKHYLETQLELHAKILPSKQTALE